TRTSSFAMWKPNSSTRRRSSASAPSAMRAPRFARRLASLSSSSASSSSAAAAGGSSLARGRQLVGAGVGGLVVALEQVLEALADEAQLAAVRLVEVLVADLERER